MDLAAVATGLSNAADAISSLRCTPYQPDSVTPPSFAVGEVDVEFDQAMHRGLDVVMYTCRLFVSSASDRSGPATLYTYLEGSGPTSLKTALEADKTLGGACQQLRVVAVRGAGRLFTVGLDQYIGAEFTVRVWG